MVGVVYDIFFIKYFVIKKKKDFYNLLILRLHLADIEVTYNF